MTDEVWLRSGNHCSRSSRYHTDKDCKELDKATGKRPMAREQAEARYQLCKICAGTAQRGQTQSQGHLRSLKQAAEGDV